DFIMRTCQRICVALRVSVAPLERVRTRLYIRPFVRSCTPLLYGPLATRLGFFIWGDGDMNEPPTKSQDATFIMTPDQHRRQAELLRLAGNATQAEQHENLAR